MSKLGIKKIDAGKRILALCERNAHESGPKDQKDREKFFHQREQDTVSQRSRPAQRG
jgi:hypothetical protein